MIAIKWLQFSSIFSIEYANVSIEYVKEET